MLPIAYVITNLLAEDGIPLVKGIEVEVVCVNISRAVIVDDYCTAGGAIRLAIAVRSDTFEPLRILGDIVNGGEINVLAAECIQGVEVVQCQGIRGTIDDVEVNLWPCVG